MPCQLFRVTHRSEHGYILSELVDVDSGHNRQICRHELIPVTSTAGHLSEKGLFAMNAVEPRCEEGEG